MSKTIYPASLLCDFYKLGHKEQYPNGTECVYSTWTARGSRLKGVKHVVSFGMQAFIKKYLIEYFNEHFFNRPERKVIAEYERFIKFALGVKNPDSSHIKALWQLGYLPIKIKAVKEGTLVPVRVPMATIESTHDDFYWVTNYIETLMSAENWIPSTSATIALQYKKLLTKYATLTGGNLEFVNFQAHDFSMRGMSIESGLMSGAGHLTSFFGTDTIPAIFFLEEYYNANIEKELVGTSVNATEHSVMCAGGKDDEYETYRRLIEDIYPTGILSIVSDTWDLWYVLTTIIPKLKNLILDRDGKVVIRPDSGDPVKIICGTADIITDTKYLTKEEDIEEYFSDFSRDYFNDNITGDSYVNKVAYYCNIDGKTYRVDCKADIGRERGGYTDSNHYFLDSVRVTHAQVELSPSEKGVIEILWETFGGTVNEKGFKELDPHIGAIYGDSITLERAEAICEGLMRKGFASTNIVFGIGSFTYQFNTRDTFMFAMKATHVVINGEERAIFKDPITDDGTKKSATGRIVVFQDEEGIDFRDGLNIEGQEYFKEIDLLEDVFIDGKLIRDETLAEIRERVQGAV